ncbi:ribosome small subunit-dependent GTPase A [Hanamia caeni]|jgi:ribosome biogenesis GTPase|uniref:Small ribosomal subunit biogenesis GTPase RsgA n=1 Tax=Hanamia caeni TaxID=2294116 RepID=A0A3M9NHX6_9BACT|nr:ribosome small subunit-dependent GTPase A [Hanamia caeni]RNI37331.1 ribosome small subunit-dependent GTPase A [Hanamia caeni]
MTALIYKSTGSWYVAKNEKGEEFNARIKGKFKIDDITSTNPIAVGDIVDIDKEEGEASIVITKIHDRKNYITRQSPHNKFKHHIVAANLHQSILLATLKDPKTSTGFIDRFLVASEAYHVPAIIVFNKTDLHKAKEKQNFEKIKAIYEKIGYPVYSMSLAANEGVEEVKELLKDKITLISGHSGVGKSSFINTIFPGNTIKTQEVSGWSGKGLHTTTFAEMFDLPFGGKIIDTPGMREFAMMDIEPHELSHYFPEMKALIHDCKFNNCMHIEEPGCAVKPAVEENKISPERYISYLNILGTIDNKKW